MNFPFLDLLIVIGCIVALWFGANWIVDSAVRIARKIGLPELIIGLTIVAIGTSAPEFSVTISSALRDQIDISIGNVIGSNIFNVGFILGGLACFIVIPTTRNLVYRDGGMLVGTTILLLVFLLDLTLMPWEGIVLLTILALYIIYLIYQREEVDEDVTQDPFTWTDIPMFIGGCIVVVASGDFFVASASAIAAWFGVTDWVIGVTIVAFGTSAPEIATSAVALMRGHTNISAGNLVGSNLFNLLGVLGLASLLAPNGRMIVDQGALSSTYVLLGLMIVVVVMMRTDWKVTRVEGAILFVIALISWILNFTGWLIT